MPGGKQTKNVRFPLARLTKSARLVLSTFHTTHPPHHGATMTTPSILRPLQTEEVRAAFEIRCAGVAPVSVDFSTLISLPGRTDLTPCTLTVNAKDLALPADLLDQWFSGHLIRCA